MEAVAAVPGHAAAAPAPGPVHDLKTLVLSRHPGIVIETAEPERADRLLSSVASDLRLMRFSWSVTSGLVRGGDGKAVYDTTDPAKALASIAALRADAQGRFVPVR